MTDRFNDVTVQLDVPATMRDGTVLRANVYRPAGDGRWPVLLTRLPYGKDFPIGGMVLDPVQTARRGYVVVVQDTRGRFSSDGDYYPYRLETEDSVDTIAWAAGLPGADGGVGMYGASYFGNTQWLGASEAPPALKAIVPFVTWCDPRNGHRFRGGAMELGKTVSWHIQQGFNVLARRHRDDPAALAVAMRDLAVEQDALANGGYASLPLASFAPLVRHDVAPAVFTELAGATDPACFADYSLVGKHDRVQVPSFNVGGWYDIFLQDTIANFLAMTELGKPSKLLLGPWSHIAWRNPIGELNFGTGAQIGTIDLKTDFGSLQVRWFDHWLKGRETGIMDEPPIKLFVMGANVWRDEDAWPLARAAPAPYFLHSDGRLSPETPGEEPADAYEYDPHDPVPTLGGGLLMQPDFMAGPYDQRDIEARRDVLVFTSEPLAQETEVTGPVQVRLWAASSAPDTDFVGRLCDVHPDGRSINLTDGIIRARHRGMAQGEPASLLEPGRPYEYEIDLWATSNLFKAGHRIQLQITSSCFPRWDRNPNTGHDHGADAELAVARQTVFHDRERPSCVVLPVVQAP